MAHLRQNQHQRTTQKELRLSFAIPPTSQAQRPPTTGVGAAETGDGGEPADQRDRTAQDGGPAERGEGTTEEAPGGTDRDGRGEARQRRGCAPNLSFRFPDLGKNCPEQSSPETEVCLQKLKDDIIRTYNNHKVSDANVNSYQRALIKDLANNDSVVAKQSDKCKGFVILDKPEYVEKAKAMLEDKDSYESISKNPVPQVEARAKRTLLSTVRGKLPDKTVKDLIPGHSRTPVFYGVPKDHKPAVPLRPVISACGGPTEKKHHAF